MRRKSEKVFGKKIMKRTREGLMSIPTKRPKSGEIPKASFLKKPFAKQDAFAAARGSHANDLARGSRKVRMLQSASKSL
jgi:hypothetical protein